MEKGEEKDFVLNALLLEFNDIGVEARKVVARYKLLGCGLANVYTLKTLDIDRMKTEYEK